MVMMRLKSKEEINEDYSIFLDSIYGKVIEVNYYDEETYQVLINGRLIALSKGWLEPVEAAPHDNINEVSTDGNIIFPLLQESVLQSVSDAVNNPSHYQFGKYEPVKVIQDWDLSFCLGNVVKYIARAGRKDSSKLIEDLEKAKRYLELELDDMKGKV